MNRRWTWAKVAGGAGVASLCALALCALAGCGSDRYAHILLEPDTLCGQIGEDLLGSSEQLIRTNKITLARRIDMPDDTPIDVWVAKAPAASRGTVLLLHDLGDSKAAFVGQDNLAGLFTRRGFDVVMPDLRMHGRSGGQYVTFGAQERFDQQRVVNQLLDDKTVSEPLYVLGIGLGGSVAVQYAAIEPRVQGVLAVAPPQNMRTYGERLFPLLSREQVADVVERAGQIAGFEPSDASAVRAAARLHCPLLLMHGRLDRTVPYTDSQAIYAAAGGAKELDLDPLAGHIGAHFFRERALADAIERLASGRLSPTTQPP